MRDPVRRLPAERGIALVMALLVLLVLSLLAVVTMSTVNVDTKITGHNLRSTQALNLAEAGTSEAVERLSAGDVPDALNPRMVAQIFTTVAGSVPVLGADSTALATAQPAGSWLNYSRPDRGPGALTVTYKTNAARTQIYRYDPSKNPAIQTSTGMPIFQITSTGTSGNDTRTVVTEVVTKPITPQVRGAITARTNGVQLACGAPSHGPFMFNGMNHRADTPTGAGATGPDPQNYTGAGDLPAVWCTEMINWGTNGEPPVGLPQPIQEGQPVPDFYAGPWSTLGMAQAEYYQWLGPRQATVPATLKGVTYLDDNDIAQDKSGAWVLNGVSGEGLLYVDGDLVINGDFTWRGLIYVEGKIKLNCNVLWMLGSITAADPKSNFQVHTGQYTFLYSSDAIAQTISRSGGAYMNLSWREVP